ncbi:hypothetical protein AG1IA_03057 [Rhizoctonia solani AG-1 IA]|uniref:Uncharacterized protein n=1 Tax=Thanatephorus cucumeris (strain AG1-IA) TaxID=983506 RepID=L8WXV7_THACA|nr:hypothetical protein AG1IA_03057 [Rhizoctonia solani AG-1 IA]
MVANEYPVSFLSDSRPPIQRLEIIWPLIRPSRFSMRWVFGGTDAILAEYSNDAIALAFLFAQLLNTDRGDLRGICEAALRHMLVEDGYKNPPNCYLPPHFSPLRGTHNALDYGHQCPIPNLCSLHLQEAVVSQTTPACAGTRPIVTPQTLASKIRVPPLTGRPPTTIPSRCADKPAQSQFKPNVLSYLSTFGRSLIINLASSVVAHLPIIFFSRKH